MWWAGDRSLQQRGMYVHPMRINVPSPVACRCSYYAGADLSVRCSGQESWLDRACLFRCGLERLHE